MGTYYLVYAFDKECENSLILKQGTLEELDTFTSQFLNSDDIRKKFKKEIELFRERKKVFIESVERKRGRRETGDIVIHFIECKNNEKTNNRIRVIYKYHKSLLDELIKNKTLMKLFSKKCYKEIKKNILYNDSKICRLSEYQCSKISFPESTRESDYKSALNEWKKDLKKSDRYFCTMREIFNIYKELCKSNNSFIPFETLITKYKNLFITKKSKIYNNKNNNSTKVIFEKKECNINFMSDPYIDELEDLMHTDDWYGFEDKELENDFIDYARKKIGRK